MDATAPTTTTTTPRLVIAGVSSGVGKTTITCSIIDALRRRGLSASPFKVGPDYIDPMYLGAIAGRDAYNLDEWLMGDRRLLESFAARSGRADVSVIEGVMGYYDGLAGDTDRASTYHVARITRSPVILVIDASKAARSVAATALGFKKFRRDSRIEGVILNRLGSKRHASICTQALEQVGIRVAGSIPRDASVRLEERHLGLHSTADGRALRGRLREVTARIAPRLDMDVIWGAACSAGRLQPSLEGRTPRSASGAHPAGGGEAAGVGRNGSYGHAATAPTTAPTTAPHNGRNPPVIAVALDSSFNFYYPDNLDALRREGASLKFFSPTRDTGLPACDGLYIGGGFPEVLAAPLADNHVMKSAVRRLAEDGAPIYAECGGLMYLARDIVSARDDAAHRMVGLFDARIVMTGRPVLGYTSGAVCSDTPITGGRGRRLRGHEFHYSRMTDVPADARFAITLDKKYGTGIADGRDGIMQYCTLAAYGHLYFDMSDFASRFVAACAKHKRR